MIPLGDTPQQGYLIDTPGIKGFGTLEMDENNLGHYFREFLQPSGVVFTIVALKMSQIVP